MRVYEGKGGNSLNRNHGIPNSKSCANNNDKGRGVNKKPTEIDSSSNYPFKGLNKGKLGKSFSKAIVDDGIKNDTFCTNI